MKIVNRFLLLFFLLIVGVSSASADTVQLITQPGEANVWLSREGEATSLIGTSDASGVLSHDIPLKNVGEKVILVFLKDGYAPLARTIELNDYDQTIEVELALVRKLVVKTWQSALNCETGRHDQTPANVKVTIQFDDQPAQVDTTQAGILEKPIPQDVATVTVSAADSSRSVMIVEGLYEYAMEFTTISHEQSYIVDIKALDTAGQPVKGAQVTFSGKAEYSDLTEINGKAQVALVGVPGDNFKVQVAEPTGYRIVNFEPATVTIDSAGCRSELTVTFQAPIMVLVTVENVDTGLGMANLNVTLDDLKGTTNEEGGVALQGMLDVDKEYEFRIENLPADRFTLDKGRTITIPPGTNSIEHTLLVVPREKMLTLNLSAIDTDGSPVAEAMVFVRGAATFSDMTGADGRIALRINGELNSLFTIDATAPTGYQLVSIEPDSITIQPGVTEEAIKLRFQSPIAMTITVKDIFDEPISGLETVIGEQRVTTNNEGMATINGQFQAGENYEIGFANLPGNCKISEGAKIPIKSGQTTIAHEVKIQSTVYLDIKAKDILLKKMVDLQNLSISADKGTLNAKRTQLTTGYRTLVNLTFEIEGYQFVSSDQQQIQVVPRTESYSLEVELLSPINVELVTADGGTPVPNVNLTVSSPDNGTKQLTTDAEGIARLTQFENVGNTITVNAKSSDSDCRFDPQTKKIVVASERPFYRQAFNQKCEGFELIAKAEGSPVAGVEVKYQGSSGLTSWGSTDDAGRIRKKRSELGMDPRRINKDLIKLTVPKEYVSYRRVINITPSGRVEISLSPIDVGDGSQIEVSECSFSEANALYEAGSYQGALKEAECYYRLNDLDGATIFLLGLIHTELKQYSLAKDYFYDFITNYHNMTKPQNPEKIKHLSYCYLAFCYEQLKKEAKDTKDDESVKIYEDELTGLCDSYFRTIRENPPFSNHSMTKKALKLCK